MRPQQAGARGRDRTGTTAKSRDFLATSAFAAGGPPGGRTAVRGLEHAFAIAWSTHRPALGARRLLSTPSLGRALHAHASGLARRWLDGSWLSPRMPPGRSPNLTGFTSAVSPAEGSNFTSSPLCLPIPPLGPAGNAGIGKPPRRYRKRDRRPILSSNLDRNGQAMQRLANASLTRKKRKFAPCTRF